MLTRKHIYRQKRLNKGREADGASLYGILNVVEVWIIILLHISWTVTVTVIARERAPVRSQHEAHGHRQKYSTFKIISSIS